MFHCPDANPGRLLANVIDLERERKGTNGRAEKSTLDTFFFSFFTDKWMCSVRWKQLSRRIDDNNATRWIWVTIFVMDGKCRSHRLPFRSNVEFIWLDSADDYLDSIDCRVWSCVDDAISDWCEHHSSVMLISNKEKRTNTASPKWAIIDKICQSVYRRFLVQRAFCEQGTLTLCLQRTTIKISSR